MQPSSIAQSTYSQYLYQVLMDFGQVSLAGLGTLILDRKTAFFNPNRTNISPPFTSLKLEQDTSCDSDFASKLKASGLGEQLASSIEADVIDMIQNNKSAIQILPWARIDQGNLIVDQGDKFNAFEGLEPIPTQVLTHDVERHYVHDVKMAHEPIQIKQTVPYKAGWNDYLVPTIIALSMLIGTFLWYKTYKSSQTNTTNQTIAYAPKPVRFQNSSASESILEKVDSILDNSNDLGGTEPVETPAPPTDKDLNKTKPIQDKKQVETAQKINKSPNLASNSDSGGCVIIVGAFKNDQNADKLMQKLVNQGYKPYHANVNGLKRVGISFDCEQRNPDSFKNVIKSTIAKDAWQLKDTF